MGIDAFGLWHVVKIIAVMRERDLGTEQPTQPSLPSGNIPVDDSEKVRVPRDEDQPYEIVTHSA